MIVPFCFFQLNFAYLRYDVLYHFVKTLAFLLFFKPNLLHLLIPFFVYLQLFAHLLFHGIYADQIKYNLYIILINLFHKKLLIFYYVLYIKISDKMSYQNNVIIIFIAIDNEIRIQFTLSIMFIDYQSLLKQYLFINNFSFIISLLLIIKLILIKLWVPIAIFLKLWQ